MSQTYLFSYTHAGSKWSIEIVADSIEDAKARLQRMPYAIYDGEVRGHLPASLGWLAKMKVFWINLVSAQ